MTDEEKDVPPASHAGSTSEAGANATDEADETGESVAMAREPTHDPEPPAPPLADASADALFEALWTRVLASWDDDKPHTAILEHALRSELLPELAGRYRAQKEVPGHEERAKKRLDAIVLAATQLLFAQRSPKREKAPWQLTAIVALACVALLVWLAFKVLR